MSAHDNHFIHPHYSPDQILHDGCGECAWRSACPNIALEHLDPVALARAWDRAMRYGRDELTDVSDAEAPVLRVLCAFARLLERAGFPFGVFPTADLAVAAP